MKIRKCRKVLVFEATEVVDLNPEDFRDLEENPYTGTTDKEFLEYIKEIVTYGNTPYELDSKSEIELEKLNEIAVWETYYSSLEKGEDSWLESGKENKSFYKNGGFETEESTDN
jgi:hypothetical protein